MAKKKINRQLSKSVIIETRFRRFLAMIIDWYLTQMLAIIPITFYLRNGDYLKPEMFDYSKYPFTIGISLIIYALIIGIIYYCLIPSFLWQGQTVGKKICKIKIVDENYQEIKPQTIFIRELLFATLIEGGILIMATSLHQLIGILGFNQLSTYWQYLTYIVTIASIIYAYFNKKSQSFHDKLAKTLVIKV